MNQSIADALSGDAKQNALSFAAYMNEKGMIAGGEHGEVTHKGNPICYIHADGQAAPPGPWTIWPAGDYGGDTKDDTMKEIAWAHVNICADCGCECAPGSRKTLFGKAFENVCAGAVMAFNNPDADTLQYIKKLLEMKMA